jgi:hypothetical protein
VDAGPGNELNCKPCHFTLIPGLHHVRTQLHHSNQFCHFHSSVLTAVCIINIITTTTTTTVIIFEISSSHGSEYEESFLGYSTM